MVRKLKEVQFKSEDLVVSHNHFPSLRMEMAGAGLKPNSHLEYSCSHSLTAQSLVRGNAIPLPARE
jgi:hypothetical protein